MPLSKDVIYPLVPCRSCYLARYINFRYFKKYLTFLSFKFNELHNVFNIVYVYGMSTITSCLNKTISCVYNCQLQGQSIYSRYMAFSFCFYLIGHEFKLLQDPTSLIQNDSARINYLSTQLHSSNQGSVLYSGRVRHKE